MSAPADPIPRPPRQGKLGCNPAIDPTLSWGGVALQESITPTRGRSRVPRTIRGVVGKPVRASTWPPSLNLAA